MRFSDRLLGSNLFNKALELLNYCPDSCDRSCYRCLRSYKNKFEHDLLDRFIGASLIEHLLTGQRPSIDEKRYSYSIDMLYNDLSRQNLRGVTIKRDHTINSPGLPDLVAPIYVKANNDEEIIIGLHNPLTPGHPENTILQDYKEYSLSHNVLIEDELKIRRNLPWVTDRIIEIIKG